MLRPIVALAAVSALLACAHAPRSKWEEGGKYHVCRCHGAERAPTPSEAAGFAEDESVDQFCEGTVDKCHIGTKEGATERGSRKGPDL